MLFFLHDRPGKSVYGWSGRFEDLQKGLVSSHFFFLLLHVVQPVFDRAFVVLLVGDFGGCSRGLPRPRRTRTGSVGDIGVSSIFTSDSDSSRSSNFGTMSPITLVVSS